MWRAIVPKGDQTSFARRLLSYVTLPNSSETVPLYLFSTQNHVAHVPSKPSFDLLWPLPPRCLSDVSPMADASQMSLRCLPPRCCRNHDLGSRAGGISESFTENGGFCMFNDGILVKTSSPKNLMRGRS